MSIAIIRTINIPELTAAPTISLMPRGTNSEGRQGGYTGGLLQGRLQGKLTRETLIFLSVNEVLRGFALICVSSLHQKVCYNGI